MFIKARNLFAFVFLLSLAFLPYKAFAWGQFGHLVVCDLAYRNLTDASKANLIDLFNGKNGISVKGKGKMADRQYTSFNLGCLEEDVVPRKHPDDHFINVSRDTKSIDGKSCPHNAACIFEGIDRDLAILKNQAAKKEDRVFALMAIGHWIGDIHQPLHISFADDRGGNSIDIKLQGKCGSSATRPDNLHSVWDNCLLESGLFERVRKSPTYKKEWSKNTITYRAVDLLLAQTSLTEQKSYLTSEPWQWAAESFQITLEPGVLYCIKTGNKCNYSATQEALGEKAKRRIEQIDQAYLAKYAVVAEERVKKAGFRLAHLLNLALDPNYKEPVVKTNKKP